MAKGEFFVCEHCGNLVGMVKNVGVPLFCCGEKMVELVPGSVDASAEKHLPVVEVKDKVVEACVGSVEHPSLEEHSIEWIYLETEKGGQRKAIKPGEPPKAEFALVNDKPVAVYAYCNLHGLWKTEVK